MFKIIFIKHCEPYSDFCSTSTILEVFMGLSRQLPSLEFIGKLKKQILEFMNNILLKRNPLKGFYKVGNTLDEIDAYLLGTP